MHTTVRVRILLARHRWIHWSIVVGLATCAGWLMFDQLRTVDATRSAWGATTPVLVARHDLVPDGPLDVATRQVPVAMVPDGALSELPAGTRLHQHVMRGEALTTADIAPAAGPATHADAGTAVLGVIDPLARNASVGLAVRIASEGVVLADTATVVDVVDEVVFVAVPVGDAPIVAAAAQAGSASVIYLP